MFFLKSIRETLNAKNEPNSLNICIHSICIQTQLELWRMSHVFVLSILRNLLFYIKLLLWTFSGIKIWEELRNYSDECACRQIFLCILFFLVSLIWRGGVDEIFLWQNSNKDDTFVWSLKREIFEVGISEEFITEKGKEFFLKKYMYQ